MNNIIEDQIDECCSSVVQATKNRHNIFIRLWKKHTDMHINGMSGVKQPIYWSD